MLLRRNPVVGETVLVPPIYNPPPLVPIATVVGPVAVYTLIGGEPGSMVVVNAVIMSSTCRDNGDHATALEIRTFTGPAEVSLMNGAVIQ